MYFVGGYYKQKVCPCNLSIDKDIFIFLFIIIKNKMLGGGINKSGKSTDNEDYHTVERECRASVKDIDVQWPQKNKLTVKNTACPYT